MKNCKKLSTRELQKLAEDPQNVVCHFTQADRIEESERLGPDEVWDLCKSVYGEYLTQKRNQSVLAAKEETERKYPKFARTHPLMFDRLTSADTTGQDLRMMRTLCDLYKSNQPEAWTNVVNQHYNVKR